MLQFNKLTEQTKACFVLVVSSGVILFKQKFLIIIFDFIPYNTILFLFEVFSVISSAQSSAYFRTPGNLYDGDIAVLKLNTTAQIGRYVSLNKRLT